MFMNSDICLFLFNGWYWKQLKLYIGFWLKVSYNGGNFKRSLVKIMGDTLNNVEEEL